ncbi:MAG: hypothetical protein AB7O97_18605 [Planctomycetota bacterium]
MKPLTPSFLSPSLASLCLCLCGLLAAPLAAQRYDSAVLVPDQKKERLQAPDAAAGSSRQDLRAAALPEGGGGRYQLDAAASQGGRCEPDALAATGASRPRPRSPEQLAHQSPRQRPLAPGVPAEPEPVALALRVHDDGHVHAKLDLGQGRFFAILLASTDDRMVQLPGLPMLLASKMVVATALADRGVTFDLGAPQLQHDVFLQGIALLPQGVVSSPVQVVRGDRIPASR